MQKIHGLITAAGNSLRMGYHKAFLPVDSLFSAMRLTQQMNRSGLSQIFMTLPPALLMQKAHILPGYAHVAIRHNFYAKQGYLGSIKTIVEEINGHSHGLIINPIDAPYTNASLIAMLKNLSQLYQHKPCIIVPHFGGVPGHPIFCSWHFFSKLCNAKNTSLRQFINNNKRFVRKVDFPCVQILANINDYTEMLAWHHIHTNLKRNAIV